MEEKERYRLIGLDTSQGLVDKIYDTKKDIIICSVGDADDVDNVIELLNQQDKENQQLKHAQKRLAIEELEKTLNNFKNRPAYFDVARQELCLSYQDKQFIDFINNRIKELGGGGDNA